MPHKELSILLDKIRNPDKRNWIIMVPNSLGETVTVCALADSFLKKHGHGITLVIPDWHGFIPECYPNTFDRVVYLSLGAMRQFSETGFIPPNFFCLDFPINTWPKQYGDGRLYELHDRWIDTMGSSGLSFLDMYKYILRLDWTAKLAKMAVPKKSHNNARKVIEQHKLKHKKTVIFFIGNNSSKPAPAYLWEKLAQLYLAQGYDIVINKYGAMFVPKSLNIPNVKVIDIPLDVAIPICEYAGNVVTGTNGFVFLLLAANISCHANVLLPNEICYDYTSSRFKEMNPLAGCHQLIIPELTYETKNFREWIVPRQNNNDIFDEIAHGIVFGVDNEHTVMGGTPSGN